VLLGMIGRPHGVRGQMHVTSYADPPEALASYGPLSDSQNRRFALRWRGDGIAEIAEIVNGTPIRVADRNAAQRLTNIRLYVARGHLPDPPADEYYLADLIGLTAHHVCGERIGKIVAVHDYGAGSSLEIVREGAGPLVVPFTRVSVPEVDVARGRVTVVPPMEIDAPADPERVE
jgi:16S rRNA processing protein RimM